jgi:hypothetical protein
MWEVELPCSRGGQSSLMGVYHIELMPSLEHVCFRVLSKLLKVVMPQWPTPMGKKVCLPTQVLVTFYEDQIQVGETFSFKSKQILMGWWCLYILEIYKYWVNCKQLPIELVPLTSHMFRGWSEGVATDTKVIAVTRVCKSSICISIHRFCIVRNIHERWKRFCGQCFSLEQTALEMFFTKSLETR